MDKREAGFKILTKAYNNIPKMSLRKLRKLSFFQKLFSYNGMKSQMAFMDTEGVRDIYNVKQKIFIIKARSLSAGNTSDITDSVNPKTISVINIEPQNICHRAAPISHGGVVSMDSHKDIKHGKEMLTTLAVFGKAAGKSEVHKT